MLGPDDLQDDGILETVRTASPMPSTGGPDAFLGRPLAEIERYYMEQALTQAGGNREEAANVLGIGERTLYRNIQDWKQQDKVRAALAEHGTTAAAANSMGMDEESLTQAMKKWGWS